MPYEGEYAAYRPLNRITESEKVRQLLSRCKIMQFSQSNFRSKVNIKPAPKEELLLPRLVLAIDGSQREVDVKNGYPGAKVGYCTVASVLIDLNMIDQLDQNRPFNPQRFRETENAAAIDAAFPGSNVVTRRQNSASISFREELYDHFNNVILDEDYRVPLIETYEALLALKPQSHQQKCPYYESEGCEQQMNITSGHSECPRCKKPIFSTDGLRIHERFRALGTNGEAFGLVMQVWERLLLVHLLRCFEKQSMLDKMDKIVFFIDGPLAVFGPPAWLSAAINNELKRINSIVKDLTGNDLLLLGIEKHGEFVSHFDEIDQTETPGKQLFAPKDYMLLTDNYIKERIQLSSSSKRFGQDTYFGRKFFYKSTTGAKIVANIPFLNDQQDTLDSDEIKLYPQFGKLCKILDKMVSSRYPNSLFPIISAHSQAAIPLHLGDKVLKQLAQALISER